MTETVIFVAATLIVACAILAALYGIVRDAPLQSQRQSYRRRGTSNKEPAAHSAQPTIGA